jgi:ComF family protein
MSIFCGTCVLCGLSSGRSLDICMECEAELPWIQYACHQCGEPFDTKDNTKCGDCLKQHPPFDKTIALFYYKKPIDNFITALKFADKLIYARILGDLLTVKLMKYYHNNSYKLPEIIIPVPLHHQRLRERGYNQALEIARLIAKKLRIVIDYKSCRRIKHTQAQALLPFKERKKNLIKAFTVKHNFKAKHIAIIDDVVTTGSTVSALSKVMRKQGVQTIDIWCCARTCTIL